MDQWTKHARRAAYTVLFEGDDPILTAEEIALLDALDSKLDRHGDDGVWGSDQYGIHTVGTRSGGTALGVICVYHPQITSDSVLSGSDDIDDETEERLNAALWQYSERVATLIEVELDEFVRQAQR